MKFRLIINRVTVSLFATTTLFSTVMTIADAETGGGWGYSTPDIIVTAMPLEIRSVPIHPDDTYVPAENEGPIEHEKYKFNGTFTL